MIIDYDRNPNLNTDQKLQSLIENIRLAFYDIQSKLDGVSAIQEKAKIINEQIAELGDIVAEIKSIVAEIESIANDAILRD